MSVFGSIRGQVPALPTWTEEDDDEEHVREDEDEPEEFLGGLFGRKKARRAHAVKGRQSVSVATPTGTSQVKFGTAMVSKAEINPELKAIQGQLDTLNTRYTSMAAMQQQQQMMNLIGPMLTRKIVDKMTFETTPTAGVSVNVTETKQSFDILTLLLLGGLGGGGLGASNTPSTGNSQQNSLFGGDMLSTILLLKVFQGGL